MSVLEATRSALADGLHYDVDVLARVAAELALEPTRELGTEVYKARRVIGDEERTAKLEAFLADGWRFAGEVEFTEGARFMLRNRTTYVGYEVATYHAAHAVRAVRRGGEGVASKGFVFVKKGASTSGWPFDSRALVREGWSA